MLFNIQLQGEAINTVLKHLDLGSHGEVRRVFDDILGQVQKQEAAANAAPAPEDIQSAGLSD
jgi:hypothetical protein